MLKGINCSTKTGNAMTNSLMKKDTTEFLVKAETNRTNIAKPQAATNWKATLIKKYDPKSKE